MFAEEKWKRFKLKNLILFQPFFFLNFLFFEKLSKFLQKNIVLFIRNSFGKTIRCGNINYDKIMKSIATYRRSWG